ncbi:transglycosylase SLT domain-containing protein [Nonomuraea angiospora]|uniref:aggregation-promoting factor C-terminal-like domain-containing protein n=1 Tax=Nonomuraea angiospora TaxID=46172 RepID=UPI00344B79CC
MDSKRALISVTVFTAFTAIGVPAAWADRPPVVRLGTWADRTPVMRLGSWAGRPPLVRIGTWTTKAQPKVAVATPNRNKRIALGQVVQRSWNLQEFRCLDNLWTRESNWNHHAVNRSSGAYGIPQALPAGKMRGAGRDWKSNPETQIRWGLSYIKGRYGRPCGAWGHWRSHNWY